MVIHVLLLSGFLLASIALVQAVSRRWSISESVLFAAWGFTLGGIYLVSGEALSVGGAEVHAAPSAPIAAQTDPDAQMANAATEARRPSP